MECQRNAPPCKRGLGAWSAGDCRGGKLTLISSRILRACRCRCGLSVPEGPASAPSASDSVAVAAYFSRSGTVFLCTLLTKRQRVSLWRRCVPLEAVLRAWAASVKQHSAMHELKQDKSRGSKHANTTWCAKKYRSDAASLKRTALGCQAGEPQPVHAPKPLKS